MDETLEGEIVGVVMDYTRRVMGPIRGVTTATIQTVEGTRLAVVLLHAPMAGNPDGETYLGSYLPQFFNEINPAILNITRVDVGKGADAGEQKNYDLRIVPSDETKAEEND